MKKQFPVLLLIFTFMITLFIPTVGVGAINTYSIKAGKKLQLTSTLRNPVWGSSDVSVATVSKTGLVKGKTKGKCYISAVSDGKAEVFVIKVKSTVKKTADTTTEDAKSEDAQTEPSDEVTFEGKKYSLTFADDFDSLDKSRWSYCPQQKRQDAGGEWRDSCSKVENGNYVITCSVTDNGTPISGGIQTRRKFEQTYGLYHMRFKMEKSSGLWYAFWLLTDKMSPFTVGDGAKDGAELDILEVVPASKEFCMTVHWDGYGRNHQKKGETIYISDDFFDKYHELWYVWDKDGYRLYLDGTDEDCLIFNFTGTDYGEGACAVPCYLLISAEFGSWGGKIDKAQLPAHFYVDYVQVYKEK